MPYITASIIMQVLGVAIPKLQEWQDQGAVGQRKITQWTRYLALAIATLQATGLTFIFGRGYGGSLLGQNGAQRPAPARRDLELALPDDHHDAGRRHRHPDVDR